ncbi:murein L,D-transpeptidase catalytic domain family protein [Dyadobacter sp. 32]|uniref:murein L,D-transpeptidase catalytic domain family protein n=1 Tax=Dyadobacter sp. 32 TaxID=538966 RepID=UPI0011EDA7EF
MKKAQAVLLIIALSVSLGFNRINPFVTSTPDTIRVDKKFAQPKEEWISLYDSLGLARQGLSQTAFKYAWYGFQKMKLQNPVMAIADFSQSSCKKRLYVIDVLRKKLLLNTYVAHGRNSGQEYAKSFSNKESSFQSSLGFYRTLGTYQGKHGLSLKLEGVEKGINDRAMQRAIVMHGADYVSEDFIKNTGRLGRSLGCPAVSIADSKKLINMLYNGAGLFIYSMDQKYFKQSGLIAEII